MTQFAALGTRPAPQRRPGSLDATTWRIPAALVALTLIPLLAGSLRLIEVAGGPQVLPANPRVDASPAPVVLHVVAAAVYAVGGAFQVPARLRRGHRVWHRRAGRVLITGLSVSAGWVVNGVVAEWFIRRTQAPGPQRARAATAGS